MTIDTPADSHLERTAAVTAPGSDSWRARVQRLMRTPLRQLPFWWTLSVVIWPLLKVQTFRF